MRGAAPATQSLGARSWTHLGSALTCGVTLECCLTSLHLAYKITLISWTPGGVCPNHSLVCILILNALLSKDETSRGTQGCLGEGLELDLKSGEGDQRPRKESICQNSLSSQNSTQLCPLPTILKEVSKHCPRNLSKIAHLKLEGSV